MSLDAGLSSGDKPGMPDCQQAKGNNHTTAQHELIHYGTVGHLFWGPVWFIDVTPCNPICLSNSLILQQ